MKFLFLIFFFLICVSPVSGINTGNVYEKTDMAAASIPESQTTTVDQLGSYIARTFTTQEARIRAVFVWITDHIRYDVDNMQQAAYYENEADLPPATLRTRKGVCMDYAALFAALANKAGVKTYLVVGYTGTEGCVRMGMHAWCASRLTAGWYLFDPTWGAGYVSSGKFYRQRNEDFFMIKPETMIKTHIPFDPLWQFLYNPLDHRKFCGQKEPLDEKKRFFNFADSIRIFEKLSPEMRLVSVNRRIKEAGITNSMLRDWIAQNEQQMNIIREKKAVDIYNDAVTNYNDGIARMNEYTAYYSAHLNDPKEQGVLNHFLNEAESLFRSASNKLKKMNSSNGDTMSSAMALNASIKELLLKISEKRKDYSSVADSIFFR